MIQSGYSSGRRFELLSQKMPLVLAAETAEATEFGIAKLFVESGCLKA
jgi:hypothetical protein